MALVESVAAFACAFVSGSVEILYVCISPFLYLDIYDMWGAVKFLVP